MSHGTQDYFPTFLEDSFETSTTTTTIVALIYNAGAILGRACFGALSERIGGSFALIVVIVPVSCA